jgi:hypothetical protein
MFFHKFFYRIVAIYLNYIMNKEKMYVDNETLLIYGLIYMARFTSKPTSWLKSSLGTDSLD